MAVINTDVIDALDKQIQDLKNYLDGSLGYLNTIEERGQVATQQMVDEIIDNCENTISDFLNQIRTKVITLFKEVYQNSLKQYNLILQLIEIPTDIGSVISWITNVIQYFFPQTKLVLLAQALADILTKVVRISNNIQEIAHYQPSISIPNVTVRPLNIDIDPITPEDITG